MIITTMIIRITLMIIYIVVMICQQKPDRSLKSKLSEITVIYD